MNQPTMSPNFGGALTREVSKEEKSLELDFNRSVEKNSTMQMSTYHTRNPSCSIHEMMKNTMKQKKMGMLPSLKSRDSKFKVNQTTSNFWEPSKFLDIQTSNNSTLPSPLRSKGDEDNSKSPQRRKTLVRFHLRKNTAFQKSKGNIPNS